MYFKMRDDVIYRMYKDYGYITDNSLFSYKSKSQMNKLYPGEAYISESGYIILNTLTKKPQHIDDIVKKIMHVFENVTYDELKQDTIEFLDDLEKEGFLCKGETYMGCEEKFRKDIGKKNVNNIVSRSDIKGDMVGDNQLKSLHIEVSNICNEECVHCYLTQDKTNSLMEEKLFYKIAEDARNANVINITLSGGEPLVHHKISKFLSKCRSLDFSVNVLSNLTLLDDEIIREMEKNPLLSVQTSLYSMNADIHDSITQKKGSFEKTINSLIKLSKSGIPVQISCPIMKQNKESFTDVIKWGENNGIDVTYDFVIFGSVDHSRLNLVNRLSIKEIEETFDKVIKDKEYYTLINEAKQKELVSEMTPICSICSHYFCVSAEGDAFPCVGWKSKKIGNLYKDTIEQIWNSSDVNGLRNIRRKSFHKCIVCKDRGYCTICMMHNANENSDGNPLKVSDFRCKVAELIHNKVDRFLRN